MGGDPSYFEWGLAWLGGRRGFSVDRNTDTREKERLRFTPTSIPMGISRKA